MVMLHIKLKGMQCTATYKQIFFPFHAPSTHEWCQGKNRFFSEKKSLVAYQNKEFATDNSIQAICLSLHIPSIPWVLSKDQSSFLSERSHVAYQIKGSEMYDNMQANTLPIHTPLTPG